MKIILDSAIISFPIHLPLSKYTLAFYLCFALLLNRMRNKLIILFLILGITIIGIIFFYINRPLSLPQNNTNPTYEISICNEFLGIENEISCEDAVKLAEGKYDGIAQSITQGSKFRKKSDPNPEGKDVWIIDILLNKPVSKNQQIVTKATVFLDRKTGEELKISYAN